MLRQEPTRFSLLAQVLPVRLGLRLERLLPPALLQLPLVPEPSSGWRPS